VRVNIYASDGHQEKQKGQEIRGAKKKTSEPVTQQKIIKKNTSEPVTMISKAVLTSMHVISL
jgi:hypothetical protein